MTVLVDTNIVIAALDDQNVFHAWAVEQIAAWQAASPPLVVPDIVYCEVSVAMERQDQIDTAISELGFERLSPSDEALFRAGKAFKRYREVNNGPKLGVLPDFIIGAMSEVLKLPLLTANPKDFTGYFQGLEIIAPEPAGQNPHVQAPQVQELAAAIGE